MIYNPPQSKSKLDKFTVIKQIKNQGYLKMSFDVSPNLLDAPGRKLIDVIIERNNKDTNISYNR